MNIKNYIVINWNKWYLKVKITPKSRVTEFFNVLEDNTLKIRVKSPAEKWKANKELISFLSKELEVENSKINIISWAMDQLKIIRIDL